MRRSVSSAIVAGLVAALVVAGDPSAPAALAFAPPPDPVAYPGSVLQSMATAPVTGSTATQMTAAEWNSFLQAHPELATTTPTPAMGGKLGAVGTAATALTGLAIGFDMGTGIAKAVGLPTSGDFYCDLGTLLGTSDCAAGPAEAYVPNSDVDVDAEPGWEGGQNMTTTRSSSAPFNGLAVALNVLSAPAYGATSGVISVRATPMAWPAGTGQMWTTAQVWCKGSSTPSNMTFGWGISASSGPQVWTANSLGSYCGTTGFGSLRLDASIWSPALVWHPEGDPARPPAVDPNPVRWWRTTWECSEGAGGTLDSAQFHETDPEWPGIPSAQCDAGAVTRIKLEQVSPTGSTLLYDWSAPAEWRTLATEHPECLDGSCRLELERLDPQTDRWLSCLVNAQLCLGWLPYADNPEAGPDQYRCKYAGQVVALSECKVYGEDPGNDVYADPSTGAEPTPGTTPTPEPGQSDCPPPFSWLSLFNPWWYFKGTVCAMQSAFVPSSDVATEQITRVRDSLVSRPPFSVVAPLAGVFTGLGDGWSTGCGPLPDFDPNGNGLRLPCTLPQSSWMVALRALVTLAVVVGAGFGTWHMLVASIGGRQAD